MAADSSGKGREIPTSTAAVTRGRTADGLTAVDPAAGSKPQKVSMSKNSPPMFPYRGFRNNIDKSLKGSIDADLRTTCRLLNDSLVFRTTSCCSGRIVVFRQAWGKAAVKATRARPGSAGEAAAGTCGGETAGFWKNAAPSGITTISDTTVAEAPAKELGVLDRPSAGGKVVATKHGGRIVYVSHTVVDDAAVCAEILRRLETGAVHYGREDMPELSQMPTPLSPAPDHHTVLVQVASPESFTFARAHVPPAMRIGEKLPSIAVPSSAFDGAPPFSAADTVLCPTCVASRGRTPGTSCAAEESSRRVDGPQDATTRFLSDQPLVYLKVEPLILHVECATYADAAALLAAAVGCGLKQSGLTAGKKRFIVAIRGSQRLEIPIAAIVNRSSEEPYLQQRRSSTSAGTAGSVPAGLAASTVATSLKGVKAGVAGNIRGPLLDTVLKSSASNGTIGDGVAEEETAFIELLAVEDGVNLASKREETSSGVLLEALRQQGQQKKDQQQQQGQQRNVPAVAEVTVLVTEEYLRFVLRVCNEKLNKNKEQIDRLENMLMSFLQRHARAAGDAAASRPLAVTAATAATAGTRATKRAGLVTKGIAVPAHLAAEDACSVVSAAATATAVTAPTAALSVGPVVHSETMQEEEKEISGGAGDVTAALLHHHQKPRRKHGSHSKHTGAWNYLPHTGLDDPRRLDLWGCACAFSSPYLCVFGGMARGKRVNTLLTYDVTTCCWAVRTPQGSLAPGRRFGSSLLTLPNSDFLLLLFGRVGPQECFSDVWLLHVKTWRWYRVRLQNEGLRRRRRRSTRSESISSFNTRGSTGQVCGDVEGAIRGTKGVEGGRFEEDEEVKEEMEDEIEGGEIISPPGRWRHAACVQLTAEGAAAAARTAACGSCKVRCRVEQRKAEEEKEGVGREEDESTDERGNAARATGKGIYAEKKGACIGGADGPAGAGGAQATANDPGTAWPGGVAGVKNAATGKAAATTAAKGNEAVATAGRRREREGRGEGDGDISRAAVEGGELGKKRRQTHVVWVYGGVSGAQPVDDYALDDLWRLNLIIEWRPCEGEACTVRGQWTRVAAAGRAPPALHSHAMAATEENLVLLGGIQKSDATAACPLDFRRVYVFDFASLSWRHVETQGVPVPLPGLFDKVEPWRCMRFPRRRFSHSALLVQEAADAATYVGEACVSPLPVKKNYTLLLFGGCDGSVPTGDIWLLDLPRLRWRFLSDVPHAESSWRCRSGAALFEENGKIHFYLVGGGGICFTFGSHADPPLQIIIPGAQLFGPTSPEYKHEDNKKKRMQSKDSGPLPPPALSLSASTSAAGGGGGRNPATKDGGMDLHETAMGKLTRERKDRQQQQWELLNNKHASVLLLQAPSACAAACASAVAVAEGKGEPYAPAAAAAEVKAEDEDRGSVDSGKGLQQCQEKERNTDEEQQEKETSAAAAAVSAAVRKPWQDNGGTRPRHRVEDGRATVGTSFRRERKKRFSFSDCALACMQEVAAACSARQQQNVTSTGPDLEAAVAAAAAHSPATPFAAQVSAAAVRRSSRLPPPSAVATPRAATTDALPSGKYERLGDVLLLRLQDYELLKTWMQQIEGGAATADGMGGCVQEIFWQLLATKMNVRGIAVQHFVTGPERRSNVFFLYGDGGLVNHRENGVVYHFDITRCMFASGNGTERQRFANLIYEGGRNRAERVVDLFCGVGYFSLAALTRVPPDRLQHVFACDWNKEALGYFRESLHLNRVDPSRVSFFHCNSFLLPGTTYDTGGNTSSDSRPRSAFPLSPAAASSLPLTAAGSSLAAAAASSAVTAASPSFSAATAALPAYLVGMADRVSLGLLPSCLGALQTALLLLNSQEGGVLHVHGVAPATFVPFTFSSSLTTSCSSPPSCSAPPSSSPPPRPCSSSSSSCFPAFTSYREYIDVSFSVQSGMNWRDVWPEAPEAATICLPAATTETRSSTSSCAEEEAGSLSSLGDDALPKKAYAATDKKEEKEEECNHTEQQQQWKKETEEEEKVKKREEGKEAPKKNSLGDSGNEQKEEVEGTKNKDKKKEPKSQQKAYLYVGRHQGANLLFAQQVLQQVVEAATATQQQRQHFLHLEEDKVWRFSIKHVEKVKSYAPKRYHYVVDIDCRPRNM